MSREASFNGSILATWVLTISLKEITTFFDSPDWTACLSSLNWKIEKRVVKAGQDFLKITKFGASNNSLKKRNHDYINPRNSRKRSRI